MEGKKHKKAKERVISLLTSRCIECGEEKTTGRTNTEVGERDYRCDVLTYWKDIDRRIAIEIDGKIGHSTRWANHKMDIRDRAHRSKDVFTVRLLTGWLVGANKLDDDVIWKEIEWQLTRE